MSSHAFGVQTAREMLARAHFEVGELEIAVRAYFLFENEGKHKVGSLAGTCAGTLWNLVDWVANSTDFSTRSALATAGLNTKEAIRDHVQANSPSLTLCWEITNGYKHCELTGYTRKLSQIDRAALSAPPMHPRINPSRINSCRRLRRRLVQISQQLTYTRMRWSFGILSLRSLVSDSIEGALS